MYTVGVDLLRVLYTAKNTVISPDFLVWKFCGKAQFPHIFRSAKDCFVNKFVIQVISEKTLQQRSHQQFERYFYMNIIVTIIPTYLVTNLLLPLFCLFTETKNMREAFSKLVVC